MQKRPTPCPKRKSVNSQEELIAKLIFSSRASRGVSLFFPSPGLSEKPSEATFCLFSQNAFFVCASRGVFPNEGLSHHVSRLQTVFFPRASRGVCFFCGSPDASFPTKQNGSPWAPRTELLYSPRTDPVYLSSPRTELLYWGVPTNRIAGSKSVLGGNSVRGEAQVEQFCSWGGV